MARRKLILLSGFVFLVIVVGYVVSSQNTGSTTPVPEPSPPDNSPSATPTTTPVATSAPATPEPSPTNNSPTPTPHPSPTSNAPSATPLPVPTGGGTGNIDITSSNVTIDPSVTVAEALSNNKGDHEDAEDYVWNSTEVISITLSGNSITVGSASVATVDGSKVTITSAGAYRISGSLTDGQIIVNTNDEKTTRLILSGASLSCSTSAPLYIMKAHKTIIILEENSENYITDGAAYVFGNPEEDEPNAAVFSRSDLTIFGAGRLNVDANYNDGIASKDGLIIKSGIITVDSVDDGIRGRDYLIVKNGNINLNVGGDGLKSDNDENTARGYISIENGEIDITSGGDAIEGETDVLINDGNFVLTSGGGSSGSINADASAKGIKASVLIIIEGGTFTENTADDPINSNGKIIINQGSFALSTGDDGIHADTAVIVKDGQIDITKSFEGIESAVIIIDNGDIRVKSSDDGINIAGGKDASGLQPGQGGWKPPGQDIFTNTGNYHLYINGGYIYVDADGDGIDSNGAITMTGGQVIINGPTTFMNVPVDHDRAFNMTGGFLLGVGSSGARDIAPAQGPSSSSTQYSVLAYLNITLQAGTIINIQTSNGSEIVTFKPTKTYQSIVLCSPALTKGTTYNIYYGGTSTGTVKDGLYVGGVYTPGNKYDSFTLSSIALKIGLPPRPPKS